METEVKREWENDTELFDMMEEQLYAAVISDALDASGFRKQVLRHTIRPLLPETVVVGRAMPVLCLDVYEIPDEPYQQEIAAVDSLKQNDVLICSTNGSTRICFWENSFQQRHKRVEHAVLLLMVSSVIFVRSWQCNFGIYDRIVACRL